MSKLSKEEIDKIAQKGIERSRRMKIGIPVQGGVAGFVLVTVDDLLVGDVAINAVIITGDQMLNVATQLLACYQNWNKLHIANLMNQKMGSAIPENGKPRIKRN